MICYYLSDIMTMKYTIVWCAIVIGCWAVNSASSSPPQCFKLKFGEISCNQAVDANTILKTTSSVSLNNVFFEIFLLFRTNKCMNAESWGLARIVFDLGEGFLKSVHLVWALNDFV